MEVALSVLANQEPALPEIIKLLDWRVDEDEYIMVLERPMPSEELATFLLRQESIIDEDVARVIMRQATLAAQACCRRKVFHRDIKMDNILINPDTLEIKLIDFGCGEILTDAPYRCFAGTDQYVPPEFQMNGEYHGEPTTVWSLGVLLYVMMCGDFPNRQDLQMIRRNIWTKDHLTKECCDLIRCCLQIEPEQRIELEKLSLHDWFKTEDMERPAPEDLLVHRLSWDSQFFYIPFFLLNY
ncbi:serine/threonine-protein kinase pim-2-like [Danio aesculapii]|uniref:serine/threonine-protein kinase pim-2-like n=1 Tax=Danio aesculapii TaxID=1142201 RepID=UPI0024C0CEC6|nr:serine/threonine-protein kinase pim-2-like [Danio aesculapii]